MVGAPAALLDMGHILEMADWRAKESLMIPAIMPDLCKAKYILSSKYVESPWTEPSFLFLRHMAIKYNGLFWFLSST